MHQYLLLEIKRNAKMFSLLYTFYLLELNTIATLKSQDITISMLQAIQMHHIIQYILVPTCCTFSIKSKSITKFNGNNYSKREKTHNIEALGFIAGRPHFKNTH